MLWNFINQKQEKKYIKYVVDVKFYLSLYFDISLFDELNKQLLQKSWDKIKYSVNDVIKNVYVYKQHCNIVKK